MLAKILFTMFWRICKSDVDLVCTVQWKQCIIRGIYHSRHTFNKNHINAVKHNPKKKIKTRSYTYDIRIAYSDVAMGHQEELWDHRMPIYNLIYKPELSRNTVLHSHCIYLLDQKGVFKICNRAISSRHYVFKSYRLHKHTRKS